MKLTHCSLIGVLLLAGCTPTQDKTIATVLEGISIAATVAQPFLGPYAPFALLASQAANVSAAELQSQDTAAVQLQKITVQLEAVANSAPQLQNLTTQQAAEVQAIETAINAALALIQTTLGQAQTTLGHGGAEAMVVRDLAKRPLPLTRADRKALYRIHKRHAKLMLKAIYGR